MLIEKSKIIRRIRTWTQHTSAAVTFYPHETRSNVECLATITLAGHIASFRNVTFLIVAASSPSISVLHLIYVENITVTSHV